MQNFSTASAMVLLIVASVAVQNVETSPDLGSVTGKAGTRQPREAAAAETGSLERVASRIQNRVQSRIQNRLDRNYDPQGDLVSTLKIAGDQARVAGAPRR